MTTYTDLVPALLAMCETTAAHGTRLRVGVDVVSIAWFARQISAGDDSAFIRTTFTPTERAYCAGRAERFAVRWAAKEAVAKAIGTGFRGLRPGDIEIVHHPDGCPEITAAPELTWPHGAHKWTWELSLCHEGDAAVAVAVAAAPVAVLAEPGSNISDNHTRTESRAGQPS